MANHFDFAISTTKRIEDVIEAILKFMITQKHNTKTPTLCDTLGIVPFQYIIRQESFMINLNILYFKILVQIDA